MTGRSPITWSNRCTGPKLAAHLYLPRYIGIYAYTACTASTSAHGNKLPHLAEVPRRKHALAGGAHAQLQQLAQERQARVGEGVRRAARKLASCGLDHDGACGGAEGAEERRAAEACMHAEAIYLVCLPLG